MNAQLTLPDYDTRDREGGDNFVASPSRITSAEAALAFILAGNAYFTVRSAKTGVRYTFRISLNKSGQKSGWKPMHFVSLLTGPDNTADYTYLGAIRTGLFYLTRASQMNEQSVPVRAFALSVRASECQAISR